MHKRKVGEEIGFAEGPWFEASLAVDLVPERDEEEVTDRKGYRDLYC